MIRAVLPGRTIGSISGGLRQHKGRSQTHAPNDRAETRLKRTTPIGVFPEGDTPEGISDLTGNTSDWTLSPYTDHLEVPDDVPEASTGAGDDASLVRRVGCGGAWVGGRAHAHAAFRFRGDPDFRNFALGFRVVCVAPIR